MKIPGITTLQRLNPLPLLEKAIVNAVLRKFLTSSLKSLLTAVIAGLAAFAGAPAPSDPVSAQLWLGAVLLIRTAISAISKFLEGLAVEKPAA